MKRWSKLQREIHKLFSDDLNVRIQCRLYRMDSQYVGTDLPRYWVTLNGKALWDYPKDFPHTKPYCYPYMTDISEISELIREYIDTPRELLLEKAFTDPWHLTDILLASDRRLGRRQLDAVRRRVQHPGALEILSARWGIAPSLMI